MKNVAFLFAFVIIALTSCQKEETEAVQPENSSPNFQIYFGNENLKSSGVLISYTDTIQISQDMKYLFWATKEDGSPINLTWLIIQTLSDWPGYSTTNQSNFYGDQIGIGFSDPGYYHFNILEYPNAPEGFDFWVYVPGYIPGKIGDDWQNEFVFRTEKKYYPAVDAIKLFIYFKFSEDFPEEEVSATLFEWEPGSPVSLPLSRYPFSDENYFYAMLDISEDLFSNCMSIEFWGPNGKDSNVWKSDWVKKPEGVIPFCIP